MTEFIRLTTRLLSELADPERQHLPLSASTLARLQQWFAQQPVGAGSSPILHIEPSTLALERTPRRSIRLTLSPVATQEASHE